MPTLAALHLAILCVTPVFAPVEDGIEIAEVKLPHASSLGDSTATIVRVDPAKRPIEFFAASLEGKSGTAPAWAKSRGLSLVVNASMFEPDGKPTGYARSGDLELNALWKKSHKAVFVSGPSDPTLPAADIVDLECDGAKERVAKYRVALQSLRMVTCEGENAWAKANRRWSSVFAAVDGQHRVLFIHTRSPYSMNALVADVLSLGLGVQRAVYLEGGPEASLWLSAGKTRVERIGSYETGFNENDDNRDFWVLPNVLGIRASASSPSSARP
jgi:hypothetical protein